MSYILLVILELCSPTAIILKINYRKPTGRRGVRHCPNTCTRFVTIGFVDLDVGFYLIVGFAGVAGRWTSGCDRWISGGFGF